MSSNDGFSLISSISFYEQSHIFDSHPPWYCVSTYTIKYYYFPGYTDFCLTPPLQLPTSFSTFPTLQPAEQRMTMFNRGVLIDSIIYIEYEFHGLLRCFGTHPINPLDTYIANISF
jgi:hypothetical protein